MSDCPKCGGSISNEPGIVYALGGGACWCDFPPITIGPRRFTPPEPIPHAWECPRCKRVNAPFVRQCECQP